MRGWSILALLWLGYAQAGESTAAFSDDAGCKVGPLAQFGQYLGDWDIEDASLSQETGSWEPGPGARWVFKCLGNGVAIQDFWMPHDGSVGTNLRTYHAPSQSWQIVWAAQGVSGLAQIKAEQNSRGQMMMHYVAPVPDPLRRIIFEPASAAGWRWTLEIQRGDQWLAVYRIRAIPRAQPTSG